MVHQCLGQCSEWMLSCTDVYAGSVPAKRLARHSRRPCGKGGLPSLAAFKDSGDRRVTGIAPPIDVCTRPGGAPSGLALLTGGSSRIVPFPRPGPSSQVLNGHPPLRPLGVVVQNLGKPVG
jgi:hypothetical protein